MDDVRDNGHGVNAAIEESPLDSKMSSAIFVCLLLVPAIGTVLFGAVDQVTWALFYVVWIVLVVSWVALGWRRGGVILNRSVLLYPLGGLLIVGLLQLLPTAFRSVDPATTYFFDLRLLILVTFFAGYITFINNETRLRYAVNFIVIFGALMAFFGILQRLASPDAVIYGLRETPQAVPFGSFVNQHHFAAFMEMTGGVTLGLLFGKKLTRDRVVLYATAIIIMGAAIAFTGSRGGMLSFGTVLCVVLLSRITVAREDRNSGRWRSFTAAIGGVGILAVIVGIVLFLGGNDPLLRGTGVVQNGIGDVSNGRFHFWSVAIKIFLEHPIFGSGFDTFQFAFTKFDTWSGFFRVEQAHNDYLQTLSDAGLVGLACVIAFIFLLFRQGLRIVRDSRDFRRSTAIGALAGCFGVLVHSFFDFPLRTYSNSFFFLLLAAIATVPIAGEHQRRHKSHHR